MKKLILAVLLTAITISTHADISIIPSVFDDQITIKNETTLTINVSLYNIEGKEAAKALLNPGGQIDFNTLNLKRGYYFVRLQSNGKTEIRRIFKL